MLSLSSGRALLRWQILLRPRARLLLCASAVLLAAFEVYIDLDTWIELNVSIVYSLPLVLAAAGRSRKLIWLLVAALLAATFEIYVLQTPPAAFHPLEPRFLDRLLASVTLVVSAALLHGLTLMFDALEARRRQAEAASERKSRLLASVSHDVRTPLSTINVLADLIGHSAADPALARGVPGLAHTLQASALSIASMVTDVLDMSALDAGGVALRPSEFRLDELLAQECRALEPLARGKGLALRLDPAEAIPVRADRVKLARIVRNLVGNAIKFTDAGGVTVACATSADGAVSIRVSDTGIGIGAADLERIFGEYAQLPASGSAGKRGWGLGLAISRRLAQMMGGDITVHSTPGSGSTFTVHLPAAWRQACAQPPAPSSEERALSPRAPAPP